MRIGIDLGKVIIGGSGEADTSFFSDNYLQTPEVEGSWQSLNALKKEHDLYIISKCGPKIEEKSLRWLNVNGFYLPLRPHRINFVRHRHLKAPMAQALELDIFIDDRLDIIESMEGIVKYPILFNSWVNANIEIGLAIASEG